MENNSRSGHPASNSKPPSSSDHLLHLLLNPACRLDAAGNILSMNPAWASLAATGTGFPAGPWIAPIAPEDRDTATNRLLSATLSGNRADFECRMVVQGTPRWFLLSLQPCRGAREDATGWICIATDIHAMKRRELELQLQARIHTAMLDIGLNCIKLISTDGRLIHLNRSGRLALGVPPDSPLGMEWLSMLPEGVREAGETALAEARAGRPARFAGRSEPPGGKRQYWDNMLTPFRGNDGHITAILCVSRDVTAERAAQASLQQSERRLAIAARVGGLGVWDLDLRTLYLQCDDSWYHIMGRDPARPIHSPEEFRPFIHPEDVARATEIDLTLAQLIATQSDYAMVFRIVRPDGEIRWVRSAASVLKDEAGRPTRAVGFVVDITDTWSSELALRDANRALEMERETLTRQSREDALTGVANRRYLDSELVRICMQAQQLRQTVTVAMIDVDHFKAYNDHYGHLQGDQGLRRVAGALQSITRSSDLVARYGGEEFVMVFLDLAHPEPALGRLTSAIEALDIAHRGSPFGRLTISCGCVVVGPGGMLTPAGLLAACDDALYEAKALGRNQLLLRFRQTGVGEPAPGSPRS